MDVKLSSHIISQMKKEIKWLIYKMMICVKNEYYKYRCHDGIMLNVWRIAKTAIINPKRMRE